MEENAVQPQAEVKVFEGSSGGILKTMEDMEGDLNIEDLSTSVSISINQLL